MRIKQFLIRSILVSCLFFVVFGLRIVSAGGGSEIYFNPAIATLKKGEDITVTVKMQVVGSNVFGADATVTFSSSDLDLKSVAGGGFFTNFTSAQSNGRIELHGFMNYPASQTGEGNFANITFSSKRDSAGNGAVSFVCASGGETQIWDTDGNNILNCNNINQLNITYTSSASTSNDNNGYPPGYTTPNSCGGTCGSNYNCAAPLFCFSGFCRSPDCHNDLTCSCKATPTPIPTQKPKPRPTVTVRPTPETVELTVSTPLPTYIPTPAREPTPTTTSPTPVTIDFKLIALISGAAAVIFFILSRLIGRKKGPPKITPPMVQNPPSTI